MTTRKCKLSGRWSACRGSPSRFSLACFKQEEQTKLTFFPFRKATVLPLRNALTAVGYPFVSVPARCTEMVLIGKRGSGDGQRLILWDYGTTERSFNAVDRRGSKLT